MSALILTSLSEEFMILANVAAASALEDRIRAKKVLVTILAFIVSMTSQAMKSWKAPEILFKASALACQRGSYTTKTD